ncbi:Lacal_2735 family protein [Winogradskyella undariae]|uniref:Lacal_2735 family protein n=1 Tax=Winogradskyella TaxID=286104 RepID=UPI00156B60AC|nr:MULTISPECIES: Lacal_2735 family protein [Winogradskyella]NRR92749.1 Lacal_2735 family protein [Winogradskyella undariae]QXP79789.1 Lacal_2735 family protein [Winogradskyella sp. HaHa_3_26]
MNNSDQLLEKRTRLKKKYTQLIEEAYNLRQSDQALSDFSEYKATKVLYKINKLEFVVRDSN